MKNLATKIFSVSALIWALVGLSLVDFEAANSSEIYAAPIICSLGGLLFSVIPSAIFVLSKKNSDIGKGGARFFNYGILIATAASFFMIPILLTSSAGRLDDSLLVRLAILFGVVFVGAISGGAYGVLTRVRSDPDEISKPSNPWSIVVVFVILETIGMVWRLSTIGTHGFTGQELWIYALLSIRVIIVSFVVRKLLVRYKDRLGAYEALQVHIANRGKGGAVESSWAGEMSADKTM